MYTCTLYYVSGAILGGFPWFPETGQLNFLIRAHSRAKAAFALSAKRPRAISGKLLAKLLEAELRKKITVDITVDIEEILQNFAAKHTRR